VAPIVVIGTGGMGREALAWLADTGRGEDVIGFLDDAPAAQGTTVAGLPVLGHIELLTGALRRDHGEPPSVVVAIGAPSARHQVIERLAGWDVALATVVHPTVTVGPRTSVGPGAILCPQVVLTCDVSVGRGAIVNFGAVVGHDTKIGEAAFVAPGAHVAGNVTIGACVDVGIGASVIQGVTIGEHAVIGAGAVVIRDVDPGTTVVGSPARPLVKGGA
jgi:sugar O-acyltransferase (sialic acid O-acetyltransferase NeuD family)